MLWRVKFYSDGVLQNFANLQNQLRYETNTIPDEHVHIQHCGNIGQIIGPYIYNYSNFQLNYERDSRSLAPIKSVIFHKKIRQDAHVS